jgi:hypothetical protein
MWVRFTADFDWKPKPQATIAFRLGDEKNVTRDCAEKAVAAGKAVRIKRNAKADGEATDSGQP